MTVLKTLETLQEIYIREISYDFSMIADQQAQSWIKDKIENLENFKLSH